MSACVRVCLEYVPGWARSCRMCIKDLIDASAQGISPHSEKDDRERERRPRMSGAQSHIAFSSLRKFYFLLLFILLFTFEKVLLS